MNKDNRDTIAKIALGAALGVLLGAVGIAVVIYLENPPPIQTPEMSGPAEMFGEG